MSNTIGKSFKITTYGESHGTAVGCVIDGCPSCLELTDTDIQKELDRRKPGQSAITTPRFEEDKVEILSGIFENKTTGAPISMLIRNCDADSSKYFKIKDTPRPGHADLMWEKKFNIRDFRGGGRSSARETATRVAGGAVAMKLLKKFGIEIIGFCTAVGEVMVDKSGIEDKFKNNSIQGLREIIESNPVRCIDQGAAELMEKLIVGCKNCGDSIGGVIELRVFGIPIGFGEPVFDKLSADIAKALISIPAVKGFEIGRGFELAKMRGSDANDEFIINNSDIKTKTNNCGGILGGISNGMPIIVRIAIKPTASISQKQKTVNIKTMKAAEIEIEGRHDPCIVPRAIPVADAMMALVLADHGIRSGFIPRKLD